MRFTVKAVQVRKVFGTQLICGRWAYLNIMGNKAKEDEYVARLIGTGTWLDWLKKIPKPEFAFGEHDLYSVFLEGTNFTLPIDGIEKPVIGFYTTRYVTARNLHAAEIAAIEVVHHEWSTRGYRKFSGNEPTIRLRK